MHTVGHHLQIKAMATAGPDRDAYARSAFNRYYYGAFLTIRSMLREMDSKWSRMPHADYPNILSGRITKELGTALRRARKTGDKTFVRQIEHAKRSTAELKKVISTVGTLRVVADYCPEEAVDFTRSSRFALRSVEVTEAHNWQPNADLLCRVILQAWKQIHA